MNIRLKYRFKRKSKNRQSGLHRQGGQIVVEYVLLLVVAVSLSALLVKQLVSRNPEDAGILTRKWNSILKTIGDDLPDKRK